jgi:hypothetical protein
MATVAGGVGRESHWKYDEIVFATDPVDLFSFLLDTVVNWVLLMIMLDAKVAGSGGGV